MVLYRNNDKPYFIMLIGIAGSGKSTLANQINISYNNRTIKPIICSSDNMREKLYGDANIQENNELIYKEIHKQIKDALRNGKDVVYDATNLNKRKRAAFIAELKSIQCYKEAVCVMTPFRECVKANEARDRVVPYKNIKKMYMDWTPPCLDEGFDHISLAYHWGERRGDFSIKDLFHRIDDLDQDNSHHVLTLGSHCRQAASYIFNQYPEDEVLGIATLLHDNGKEFSKTRTNARGVDDGQSHYYQHHCVGAYDSMFYTANMNMPVKDRLRTSLLIYYHMHPYMQWQQSNKSLQRDLMIMPSGMYDDIQKLHDADVKAHNPSMRQFHHRIDDIMDKDMVNNEIKTDFVIER